MLSTLGERIRTIRKQRKMTLDSLAGEQMTKAMMSYIENNKANPSMESLSYIAERLGVKVSELLEDVNPSEVTGFIEDGRKYLYLGIGG